MNTVCSTIMSSSLYLFPNSTLPNGPGYYVIILQNPLYLVVKFTLPNHIVNSAQESSPCCQINIAKVPIPHQQGNIAKLWSSNSLLWTAQMSHHIKNFRAVLCLRSTEISAQKIKLPWSWKMKFILKISLMTWFHPWR